MGKNDGAGAARDLESATALARHVGERVLIGALVEVAVEKMVTDAGAACMTDAASATALAGMVRRGAAELPLHLASNAILTDRDAFMPPFRAAVERHAADGTLPAWLEKSGADALGVPATMDARTLLACLDEAGSDYERAAQIVDLPQVDFEKALAEFASEAQARGNPMTLAVLPVVGKIRNYAAELKARWAMLEAGIAYLTKGPAGMEAVLDPFNAEKFAFAKTDGGFELASKLTTDKQVRLVFGPGVSETTACMNAKRGRETFAAPSFFDVASLMDVRSPGPPGRGLDRLIDAQGLDAGQRRGEAREILAVDQARKVRRMFGEAQLDRGHARGAMIRQLSSAERLPH